MRGITAGPLWQCRSTAPANSSLTCLARDSAPDDIGTSLLCGIDPGLPALGSQAFCPGMGYSSALSTQPGFSEKSILGGENRSTIWLKPGSTEREVCTDGGGITVSDGAPQWACSS